MQFGMKSSIFGARRIPVDDEDVVAAAQQKFDQALARRQVEHVGLVGGRHDQQQRHAVDVVA
jgi:hypothetical protein